MADGGNCGSPIGDRDAIDEEGLQRPQVDGRFFPKGTSVNVIHAGSRCLVLPDSAAHTTLCAGPLVAGGLQSWPAPIQTL